ncbi:MAG: immunoglobulin-like domain-containing protein [Patescibacteria group bacterium]
MKHFLQFISYHNAIPIFFGILFLGGAGAFAASPEARDTVLQATEVVRSVDNSYIVNVDVTNYPYDVAITQVSEDGEQYYVDYTISTVDIEDYVWRSVVKRRTLAVSKDALVGKDLAAHVSTELTQAREAERARLIETQKIEQSLGTTQKVVATEYSGLLGALVPPKEEVFVEYVPEQVEDINPLISNGDGIVAGVSTQSAGSAPTITIFGNNPARINVGDTYADLGFLALYNGTDQVATYTYVNDKQVRSVVLDTTIGTIYTITYEAISPEGDTTTATRTVIVGSGKSVQDETVIDSTNIEENAQSEETAATTTKPLVENFGNAEGASAEGVGSE